MSEHTQSEGPSRSSLTFTVIAFVGVFLTFLFIVGIAYLPNRPEPVDQAQIDERLETLSKVRASEKKEIDSYGWIDKSEGVVRIPVSQAMQLTVKDLKVK